MKFLLLAPRSSLLASLPRRRPPRRGVLLLVVLSMLVLFMLIGTAFLMSSSQEKKNATNAAKDKRLGNYATKSLDRALLQVLRDTDNPYSVVRYHSLLRDLYGTEGFQGVVYSPATVDLATAVGQLPRFAAADASSGVLGPTQGQFIDIYISQLGASTGDPLDLRHVLKLDRNVLGQPQVYNLPLTKGYYNGCILTMTSGPAAGQSTRILEYEYMGEFATGSGATLRTSRVLRFRVMAFSLSNGTPFVARAQLPATDIRYSPIDQRGTELVDLVTESRDTSGNVFRGGHSFIVNGRAFGGTGVGYNPLATAGQPRLGAGAFSDRCQPDAVPGRRGRALAELGVLQSAELDDYHGCRCLERPILLQRQSPIASLLNARMTSRWQHRTSTIPRSPVPAA